jgi:pyruvate dehydrogenase E1 component
MPRAPNHGGDCLYIQGHSAPGIYARAYLEGRLTEEQLDSFRQEVDGKGLSSYPHPKLMPDFWQFPTVSMGLGPLMAIYQARFLKYLHARGIANTENRKVWAFMGDGEMDEPESLGAIGLAAREGLDNLVFVVNCNLQRLDGPVRGNGKIIQELEGEFRGSGWNVIKLIWGKGWDELLARDKSGKLKQLMMETLDGDYQAMKANDGAFVRKNFFGRYPETLKLVEHMSDEEIFELRRGGHQPEKVYAAFHAAHNNKPRVSPPCCWSRPSRATAWARPVRARTPCTRPRSSATKTSSTSATASASPFPTASCPSCPTTSRPKTRPRCATCTSAARHWAATCPSAAPRPTSSSPCPRWTPSRPSWSPRPKGREISTTQAYVRFVTQLLRDQALGPRVVPILVDEARTFGMEGLFRQIGIYNPKGQLYTPVDKDQVMYYREDKAGQILQEGINEAGGMASWIAAATSYSTSNRIMVPFYVYYSMFGFQRIGDLAWAAGDMQARGFLLGGTSGRTTLNGEGLQHEDGHSHILAGTIPNCVSYDPTFAHEVAVILHHGLKRMVEKQENVFYYITLLNENYAMPGLTRGHRRADHPGHVPVQAGCRGGQARATAGLGLHPARIAGSPDPAGRRLGRAGPMCGAAPASTNWPVKARTASAGTCCTRWKRRASPSWHASSGGHAGPVVASTDYMKSYAEQIRPSSPQGAATRCWAPTALAAATSAASCVSTSRSTATTSSWPRSRP